MVPGEHSWVGGAVEGEVGVVAVQVLEHLGADVVLGSVDGGEAELSGDVEAVGLASMMRTCEAPK